MTRAGRIPTMPPKDANPPPDSALGMMNIHQAAGLDDRARKRVWETTRQAIERQGLELQGEIAAGATAVVFDAREKVEGGLRGPAAGRQSDRRAREQTRAGLLRPGSQVSRLRSTSRPMLCPT